MLKDFAGRSMITAHRVGVQRATNASDDSAIYTNLHGFMSTKRWHKKESAYHQHEEPTGSD